MDFREIATSILKESLIGTVKALKWKLSARLSARFVCILDWSRLDYTVEHCVLVLPHVSSLS